ncbi:hypothetical protein [Pseudomonas sp. NPDC089406]|uniref:hypothetical protein n=1 Tax=Pseudomonas sp. NPDC089406 TaxID=3364463 RepID=UPI00384BF7E5
MKIATLILFALADIVASLLLRRFIFISMTRTWQVWVSILHAAYFSGLYFQLLGDNGFIAFDFGPSFSAGYWALVVYSLGMVAFHMWASRIFHEHP